MKVARVAGTIEGFNLSGLMLTVAETDGGAGQVIESSVVLADACFCCADYPLQIARPACLDSPGRECSSIRHGGGSDRLDAPWRSCRFGRKRPMVTRLKAVTTGKLNFKHCSEV
jgi:hypothetical protein